MAKTSTIVDLTTGLSDSDKDLVGSAGQILLTKHETDLLDIYEYYDNNSEAATAKENWDD